MTDPKWTPGPWGVHMIRHTYFIGKPKGDRVLPDGLAAVVVHIDGRDLTDQGEDRIDANAHLIAAAPELYEALAEMVEWQEETDAYPTSDEHPLYQARIALAKARGESDE